MKILGKQVGAPASTKAVATSVEYLPSKSGAMTTDTEVHKCIQ